MNRLHLLLYLQINTLILFRIDLGLIKVKIKGIMNEGIT